MQFFHTQANDESELIDFGKVIEEMKLAYLNDLNTPKVLAILSEFQNIVQEKLLNKSQIDEFKEFLKFIDLILGLKLKSGS